MAKDGRPNELEEEREFLEGLKARTGRDLAEWMAAIAAQGFSDKNQIIDWLRTEGLPFARASWLERIHRNGGRPIHVNAPGEVAEEPRGEERPAAAKPPPQPRPVREAKGVPKAAGPTADAAAELEKLVAAAKGYRPLYHLLESQIRQAIPGVTFAPRGRYVSLGAPNEFAAVTLHPTEVRIGLDLGDRPFDQQVQKAKLKGPGAAIAHMVVLTDARQVNDQLLALIRGANSRVNGTIE
jgi:hypothetical protein